MTQMLDAEPARMTVEEFLALPDDGVDRWLIRGEVREGGTTVSRRTYPHTRTEANTSGLLRDWNKRQPEPRGRVVAGEASFRLRPDLSSLVGIDVAYLSPTLAAATPRNARVIQGAPTVAIEITSPSDTAEQLYELAQEYLSAGVAVVVRLDPLDEVVTVHRPGQPVRSLDVTGTLSLDPELPGFAVPVAEVFE